ncbi:MAG TPA: helix-turn-helix transcriptional regulator [Saprospiraceae bacterium]|nr:helix-turn-helix transcriptional regulator [Saprospiraceae bacterium]
MEKNIGKKIKDLRKGQKMTLIQMSKLVNISKSSISDYENGKSVPSLEVLLTLSKFFNVNLDFFINSEKMEFNILEIKKSNPIEEAFENEKYQLHLKLMNQKVESIHLQLQLLKQVLASKEAENKTLQINIQLLEQRLSFYTKN